MKVKLVSFGLSSNPNALVVDNTGDFADIFPQCNAIEDGNLYLVAHFKDVENPFGQIYTRTIFQQNGVWKVDLKEINSYVGKVIPGVKIETVNTPEYSTQEGRTAKKYTSVVFPTETIESISSNAISKRLVNPSETLEETIPQNQTSDLE